MREDLEEAFRDNFQGTYVRPLYADDLRHIVQEPGESARELWTRFLVKKNQIMYELARFIGDTLGLFKPTHKQTGKKSDADSPFN